MSLHRREMMAGAGASLLGGAAIAQGRAERSPGVVTSGVFAAVTVGGQTVPGLLDSGATDHAIDIVERHACVG
ncbi:MAG: hypothetical protein WCI21_00800 [Alphaproteobacteria bacterium]